MDTALNTNGDFNKDSSGKAYGICGTDELKQKIYIILSSRLGEFVYDRTLGSEIYSIDISSPTACEEITAKARKALLEIPQAEVTKTEITDGKITVFVDINGVNNAVELRI